MRHMMLLSYYLEIKYDLGLNSNVALQFFQDKSQSQVCGFFVCFFVWESNLQRVTY